MHCELRRDSVVWPNARAWRARLPQGNEGSNPSLSARRTPVKPVFLFINKSLPCQTVMNNKRAELAVGYNIPENGHP